MIKVNFKGFEKFEVKVNLPVPEIAEEVRKEIEDGLKSSRSYDGSNLAPLSIDYARMKKRKLGHANIFDGFRKGSKKLINSIKRKKVSDNVQEIYIGNNNNDIMVWLQTGAGNMKGKRKGFGITENNFRKIAEKFLRKTKISVG